MNIYTFHIEGSPQINDVRILAKDEASARHKLQEACVGGAPLVTADNYRLVNVSAY
jgi:hypothetical protein